MRNGTSAPHTISSHACFVYCGELVTCLKSEHSPASLERLVLRSLATNIQEWCPWLLQALGPDHLSVVLEELSLQLPLKFCIKNVPDGYYWQRLALVKWSDPDHGMCDVDQHDGSWRQLVLERHIQQLLENVEPSDELPVWLKNELRDAASYVRRLCLQELKDGLVAGQSAHIPLGPVLALLPELRELHIKTGPRDCGLDFSWIKFTLSFGDANSLAAGLLTCINLVTLRLHSSHVSDETLSLVLTNDSPGFLPHLKKIDLSHNELQDGAAVVLAAFLNLHPSLLHLRLINNRFGAVGAATLADALETTGLEELELSLNALGEEGGMSLATKSSRLKILRVAGCALGLKTVQVLCSSIPNSQLQTLDLSNNLLKQNSGQLLLDTLEVNKNKISLKHIDLRMTGIEEFIRQDINKILVY